MVSGRRGPLRRTALDATVGHVYLLAGRGLRPCSASSCGPPGQRRPRPGCCHGRSTRSGRRRDDGLDRFRPPPRGGPPPPPRTRPARHASIPTRFSRPVGVHGSEPRPRRSVGTAYPLVARPSESRNAGPKLIHARRSPCSPAAFPWRSRLDTTKQDAKNRFPSWSHRVSPRESQARGRRPLSPAPTRPRTMGPLLQVPVSAAA